MPSKIMKTDLIGFKVGECWYRWTCAFTRGTILWYAKYRWSPSTDNVTFEISIKHLRIISLCKCLICKSFGFSITICLSLRISTFFLFSFSTSSLKRTRLERSFILYFPSEIAYHCALSQNIRKKKIPHRYSIVKNVLPFEDCKRRNF